MALNRDFIVLLTGRLLQIAITLLSLRVLTSVMPEAELGLVYFIIAIQSFFVFALISPIGQYFNRQTNLWFSTGLLYKCLFNQSLYILLVALITFFLLAGSKLFIGMELSVALIAIISGLVFSQSLNQTIIPMINMIEKRYAFVFFNLLTAVLCTLISFIMLFFWSKTALGWLLGIVLGSMLANGLSLWWLKRKVKLVSSEQSLVTNNISKIASFALPLAYSTIFMWFLGSGYKLLIELSHGLDFLAILGVGLAVSNQIFAVVESLLTQYLVPALYRNVEAVQKDNRLKLLNTYIKTVIPIYVTLAIFLTFSIEYIFPFLVSDMYKGSYVFAVYGVWIELFRTLTNVFSITSHIEKNTTKTVLPYVLGSLILASTLSAEHYFNLDFNVMYVLIFSMAITSFAMIFKMYELQRFSFPLKNVVVIFLVMTPSVLFFMNVNIEAALTFESFLFIFVGGALYLFGLLFYFGKFSND